MSDSRLQEIVTRAVVGRAERRMTWSHTVPAEGVSGVLGVHVSDSTVAVKESDGRTVVDVIVDCDLWCGSSKSTKVLRCTCRNTETTKVRTAGTVLGEREVRGRLLGAPRATGVDVAGGKVTIHMEAEYVVEMSALARMWVKAYDLEEEVLVDLDDPDTEGTGTGSDSGSAVGTGE